MGMMSGPGSSPRRAALFTGLVILVAVVAFFVIEGPKQSKFRGMGMELILERQEAWRKELVLQGKHLNELATWEIQEDLAKRSRLSEGGVKGLSRRASNARDRVLAVEGHLIAGHQELAAELAWELAPQMQASGRFDPEKVARMWRNAGDAAWQGGRAKFDPHEAYRAAIEALEKVKGSEEERAWLWMDIASWFWSKATFFPEDPASDFQVVANAASRADKLFAGLKPAKPLAGAAAARLMGNAIVWGLDYFEFRDHAITEALEGFDRAVQLVGESGDERLRSAVLHDAGVAWLVQASVFRSESKSEEAANAEAIAVANLEQAVALRPGSFKTGSVDLRDLGPRLQARAESLAMLSRAEWVAARDNEGFLSAIETARKALELTTEKDRGHAWVVAVSTLAFAGEALLERSPSAEESTSRASDTVENALAALMHYPMDRASVPGVPSRADLLDSLAAFCKLALAHPAIREGVRPYVSDMEEVVGAMVESVDPATDPRTATSAKEVLDVTRVVKGA